MADPAKLVAVGIGLAAASAAGLAAKCLPKRRMTLSRFKRIAKAEQKRHALISRKAR